jgi:hypothetical protein
VKLGDDWNVVPSIEYVYSAPSGAVTVIDPDVGSAHVGSVAVAVAVGGVVGGPTVAAPVAWQLPATLLTTVIVYDPEVRPVKFGDDWNVVPSIL